MSTENIQDAAPSAAPSGAATRADAPRVAAQLPDATLPDATRALTALERISAIVPARNEESSIAACIDSLLAQPDVLEIIIVDDQSSDRTAEIVRQRMPVHARVK